MSNLIDMVRWGGRGDHYKTFFYFDNLPYRQIYVYIYHSDLDHIHSQLKSNPNPSCYLYERWEIYDTFEKPTSQPSLWF